MAAGKQCGLRSWAVVAFMVLCGIAHLQAATIYVSTAGSDANDGLTWTTARLTVQAGLNAAVSGDQVWVAAGTYVENITLKDGVALYGGFAGNEDPAPFDLADRDFEANETILDGNQSGSVVTAPENATASTRIDGFTIRDGYGEYGGGIDCAYSSPTIANNTITGNSSESGGGGIGCYLDSSPTIANNTITGNSSKYGGGIYCYYYSFPTIANNTITENSSKYGGGIGCHHSSPTIANNTITGNSAYFHGGGICCLFSSPTIANNTIAGNSAYSHGGGIYCEWSSPTIANNTITANSSIYYGGGICCEFSSPTIANNTITGNSSESGGGISCRSSSSPTIANTIIAFNSSGIYYSYGTPTLRYNCVYGNWAYNYSGITDPTGTDGNISADPRFVQIDPGTDGIWGTADDDYSDLHLSLGSPCINTGDPACQAAAGETDMDGDPRILSGRIDIGADEVAGLLAGDIDGDGQVNIFDIFCIAECWNTQAGDPAFDPRCDLDGDGAVNIFDIFVVAENWNR